MRRPNETLIGGDPVLARLNDFLSLDVSGYDDALQANLLAIKRTIGAIFDYLNTRVSVAR